MNEIDPMVAALIALCKAEGGEKFVADKAVVSAENLMQITKGVKLPSGNPRGVGPGLRAKITKAYPSWLDSSVKLVKSSRNSALATVEQAPVAINLVNNPDFPAIRRVNIKLSAGASGFGVDYVEDDEAPIVFQRKWFERNGYNPAKLMAVRVCNGSMEPGLYDGDTVVINTADDTPKDGEVFAVNYEGELVIKRMVRDAGQWWLASDNPDQRRYPRKVCGEDVFCIGRIVHKLSERI